MLYDGRLSRTDGFCKVLVRNSPLESFEHTVTLAYSWVKKGLDPERTQASDMLKRILRSCRIQTLIITSL
jgi:hypothetical protein